jgi:hypothetical protein
MTRFIRDVSWTNANFGRLAALGFACISSLTYYSSVSAQYVHDGRLTMAIEAQPLAAVLEAIATQASIDLKVQGDLGEAEPRTFAAEPLDRAIRRLVGDHSLVMLHQPGEPRKLIEVRVYGNSHAPDAQRVERAKPSSGASPAAPEDDRAVRLHRVKALAQSRSTDAIVELSAILENDPDAAIRRFAVSGLGWRRDRATLEPLVGALEDANATVRAMAVKGLYRLLGREAAPYLIRVIEEDGEASVRIVAVQQAAKLPANAGAAVLELALADTDEGIRQAAAAALGL